MQARIKATGQIIELCPYVYDIDGNDFLLEEVELLDSPNWQQVRIQAAIAAMQAELSNPNNTFMMCEDKRAIIVRRAVGYADALVAELQKKDDNANLQQ